MRYGLWAMFEPVEASSPPTSPTPTHSLWSPRSLSVSRWHDGLDEVFISTPQITVCAQIERERQRAVPPKAILTAPTACPYVLISVCAQRNIMNLHLATLNLDIMIAQTYTQTKSH